MKIDFHTHTSASKDSSMTPRELVSAARRRGLDRIVVTDHNSIAGAIAAHRIDPELVIVGEEVRTTRGEILAVFVTEELPRDLSPKETISRLRDQGAFISIPHPFDRWRAWRLADLEEIASLVDAVEVFNARCLRSSDNEKALEFARRHQLSGTAGSDAHAPFELGAAHLEMPLFQNANELRIAMREARVIGKLSPFWVHFVSQFASHRKKVV